MLLRLLPIAALSMAVVASGAAGAACPAKTTSSKCVNLDAIATISNQIVAAETPTHKARFPVYSQLQPGSAAYTGPTVGISSMVRHAPTVGYRWALQ